MKRETLFRIATKLDDVSKRADAIAAVIRELAEYGEQWEVEEIVSRLGDH